jgi:hypothetical protein
MDRRARLIGENEILFREVNAQMRSLDEKLPETGVDTHPFLCECGDVECHERIKLTIEEYERIHADPARFVAMPGHEKPEVEDVVEEHDGYIVLQKHPGGPAELAAEHADEA